MIHIARCSVPLFFMISGSLLFRKQDNIFLFYKKRIIRILPPLLAWSLVYMIWQSHHGSSYGNIWGWTKTVLKGPVVFHLWYFYSIIGLYIFTPFLQKIYVKSDIKEKIIFFLICFFSSTLPSLSYLFDIKMNIVSTYNLKYFHGYVGYLFIGAFLYEYIKDIRRYKFINLFGFISSTFCIMFFTYFFSKKHGAPVEFFYGYTSVFVAISSIFSYIVFYEIGFHLNHFFRSLFHYLSQLTLGIYCVHILVLNKMKIFFSISFHMGNPWWSIPCTAILAFCFSAIIISIIKKIKFLRVIT